MNLSCLIGQDKAVLLFADLKAQTRRCGGLEFKTRRGHFERFKTRANLHSHHTSGVKVRADVAAATVSRRTRDYQRGYLPKQIFSVDKAGLVCKRMPAHAQKFMVPND
jgi:hypothetical protein